MSLDLILDMRREFIIEISPQYQTQQYRYDDKIPQSYITKVQSKYNTGDDKCAHDITKLCMNKSVEIEFARV